MIVILIISLISVVNCLEPVVNNDINDDIKTIIGKYLSKIPDIEPRYVINDELSKVINHYFKGKISSLPLYKISLQIDRNPVKIPWDANPVALDAEETQADTVMQRAKSTEQQDKTDKHVRHYKVMKSSILHSSSEKPNTMVKASTMATTTEAPDTNTKKPMTVTPATRMPHLKEIQ